MQALRSRLLTRLGRTLSAPALVAARAHMGTTPETLSKKSGAVSLEQVWSLWNEGNLFSLSQEEISDFLESQGLPPPDGGRGAPRKATLVRHLEEFLQQREAAEAGAGAAASSTAARQGAPSAYGGKWGLGSLPPDALLDLSQSDFYTSTGGGTPLLNMIPKAFQLLTDDSSVDATITRVNTTTFPGYPSSTECYTLSASNSSVSIQSRYSKVLQWCYLNMVNMQVDGELHVKLGKLLIHSSAVNTSPSSGKAEEVLSTYKIQQRLQLRNPYTWITCLPESSIPIAEEFFQQAEGFTLVHKTSPTLTFEGTIRKDAEVTLSFEADDKGQLIGLHHPWSSLQSSYVTKEAGPDIFLSLQTRPPVAKNELDRYNAQPLIELSQDDVSDVLPPALGQIIYLSENFTRRFEKVTEKGIVITVTEVRRQPLIVLHDEEEDPRVEYTLSIQIPGSVASRRGEPFDVRGICVELLHLSNRFQEAVRDSFIADFGCSVESNAAP